MPAFHGFSFAKFWRFCQYFSKSIIWPMHSTNVPETLTVCSSHVTCAFQSKSTLYSCLNVKEHLVWRRCQIRSLGDCNWTGTQNHLARKRTLNNFVKLTKWLSCVLRTYLYGAFDCMFLSCHISVSQLIHTP